MLLLRADDDLLFTCHATGTNRWDLPKGLLDPGESPRDAAVREATEEAGLRLPAADLLDLGVHDYLPAKALHLFALHVAPAAFDAARCRCTSMFPDRRTGRPVPEADGYAWQRLDALDRWCGKNLSRVLRGIDWARVRGLPVTETIGVLDGPSTLPHNGLGP